MHRKGIIVDSYSTLLSKHASPTRVLPSFSDLIKAHNGPESVITQRRIFSAEYKREAVVAIFDTPGGGERQPVPRGAGDWGERARTLPIAR